jgi:membrane protease YdiL (CAAX protease family)
MTAAELIFLLVIASAALSVAAGAGVFRRGSVVGPSRVPPGRPVWPMVMLLMVGMFVWMSAASLYAGHRAGQWRQAHPPDGEGKQEAWDATKLSADDYAVLATVPPLAAFIVVLVGDLLIKPRVGHRLGFRPWLAPAGLWRGVVGIIIAMPLVWVVMILSEQFYRYIGYEHPAEHDLLRLMKEAHRPLAKALIVAGAAAAAPLWEELLFRGHLQTIVRSSLENLVRRRQMLAAGAGHGFTVLIPGSTEADPPAAPVTPETFGTPAWLPWLAIVLTSVAFASVHAAWSSPGIFFLSLCLGYAYERTGNLWVPITMHALFNGITTAIYIATS